MSNLQCTDILNCLGRRGPKCTLKASYPRWVTQMDEAISGAYRALRQGSDSLILQHYDVLLRIRIITSYRTTHQFVAEQKCTGHRGLLLLEMLHAIMLWSPPQGKYEGSHHRPYVHAATTQLVPLVFQRLRA